MDRCHLLYPEMGGYYRATEKRWRFPSGYGPGAIIDLGHMQHENDKYDFQGKEYHRVGFDEATQFTETQYSYVVNSRIRKTDPSINCQALSTTNPGGVGHHWYKERFQPGRRDFKPYSDPKTGLSRVFIPAAAEDNPSLFVNDPEYIQRLEALPEIEKLRLLHGIWDAFEGQVFTELSQLVHGCEPFDIPPEWPRFCVLDWGYAKPFCVHWYAVDYDDVIYLYREWYGSKKEEHNQEDGADIGLRLQAWEVAKEILKREQGEKVKRRIADPSIWHSRPKFREKEARGVTIQEDFAGEGVYFTEADNDRVHGKLQVHKRLQMNEDIDKDTGEVKDESPRLQVFNTATAFWRNMLNLVEDPKNPEDVADKQEDHAYDCFRYMCMANPIAPKKVVQIPSGSFRAERERLIRAKKYAKQHGVSVAAAYTRVRR